MNATIKDLLERRSIRKYTEEQVREEDLEQVLEAGKSAPTGMNRQSPVIVVVQCPECRERLRRLAASVRGGNPDGDPYYGAPTVCVIFSDPDVMTYVEDGSLVIGNMLNAAHAVGLGGCWIHGARQMFDTEEGKALMAEWGVDPRDVGIGHCILGYADGAYPDKKPRKEDYVRFVR